MLCDGHHKIWVSTRRDALCGFIQCVRVRPILIGCCRLNNKLEAFETDSDCEFSHNRTVGVANVKGVEELLELCGINLMMPFAVM